MKKNYVLICLCVLAGIAGSKAQVSFSPAQTLIKNEPSCYGQHFAYIDMNNDGVKDVVQHVYDFESANWTGNYFIKISYLNASAKVDSTFRISMTNHAAGYGYMFDVGDITNDGKPDIVILSQDDTLFTYIQTSPSKFVRKTEFRDFPYLPTNIIISDLNNDQKKDILLVPLNNSPLQSMAILYQNTNGTFTHLIYDLPGEWAGYMWDVKVGDVSGDNKNDIVVIQNQYYGHDTTLLSIIPQLANGTLGSTKSYVNDLFGFGHRYLAIGDVDGDGKNDIATGGFNIWDTTTNRIQPLRLWTQTANGLIHTNTYNTQDQISKITLVDLNCDKSAEIISQSYESSMYIVDVKSTNTQYESTPLAYGGGFITSDVDRNGTIDIMYYQDSSAIGILYNNTLSCIPPKIVAFNAVKITPQTALTYWSVMNVGNVANFIVERGPDSLHWNMVGSVTPTGSTNYTLLDNKPINGWNNYRLKMLDHQGNIIYSQVVKLYFALDKIWSYNKIIYSSFQDAIEYQLYAADGKLIKKGILQNQINCNELATGIYMLRTASGIYKLPIISFE